MDIKSYYTIEKRDLIKFVKDLREKTSGVFSTSDDEILSYIDEIVKEHIKFYWTGRLREKSLEELFILADIVKNKEYEDKQEQKVSSISEAEVRTEIKGSKSRTVRTKTGSKSK